MKTKLFIAVPCCLMIIAAAIILGKALPAYWAKNDPDNPAKTTEKPPKAPKIIEKERSAALLCRITRCGCIVPLQTAWYTRNNNTLAGAAGCGGFPAR